MIFRIRYKQLGRHIHCRVFEATSSDHTFAKNGDLVFDERSWPVFLVEISRCPAIEVLPEDEPSETNIVRTLQEEDRFTP